MTTQIIGVSPLLCTKSHRDEMEGLVNTTKVILTELTGAIDGNDKIIEHMEISKTNGILAIN